MPLELENNFWAYSAGGELAFKQVSQCKNWLICQTAQEMLPPWRYSKDIWTWSWATSSRWPCLSRKLDKMTSSHPFKPQTFCDSVKDSFGVKGLTQPFSWEFCHLHPNPSFFLVPCSQYDLVTCNTNDSGWCCEIAVAPWDTSHQLA